MPRSTQSAGRCPVTFPSPRDDNYAPPSAYRPQGSDGRPFEVELAYGGKAWLVTRHSDIRTLLSDSRLSADARLEGFPMVPLSHNEQRPGFFLSMDPPEHGHIRSLLNREFSATAVAARRPMIAGHIDRLLSRMTSQGRSADLVTAFADRLPCHVSGSLFGVVGDDEDWVRQCIEARATHDKSMARRLAAGERMHRFLSELVAVKQREPADDLLSRLVARAEEGEVTIEEVVGMATLILAASLDATSALTTLTVLSVLRDEESTARMKSDPARWVRPCVEESLRYWTVIQHGPLRVAAADIEIAGRRIRRGDPVMLHLHSANWDAEVFDHPETFDVDRDNSHHLAFGYGVHRCLGAGLGQAEATAAVETLFTRLPGLRLDASPDDLAYRSEDLVYNVRSLPVCW